MGGLGHGVGQGGDLGHDLGEGVSLSGGVGEVAAQPVVLDGGGVVSRGPHQVGDGSRDHGSRHHGGGAESDQSGEEQEGLELVISDNISDNIEMFQW